MSHSIVLIGVWFGPWPAWIDFFLLSCRANRTIDWLIFSDQAPPDSTPENVKIKPTSFSEYKAFASSRLSVTFGADIPSYKLCELKPALGYLHQEHIRDYDFFGFTDFDVIYGAIKSIYDDDILERYDALSTHTTQVSGHLFLMRNTRKMRSAFMTIPRWKAIFEEELYAGFDEHEFYKYFQGGPSRNAQRLSLGRRRPYFFREAYGTPMPTQDMRWYWRDGIISNEFYPYKSFLYLHFMVWQSNKWYRYIPNVAAGTRAPWQDRTDVVQIDWRKAQEEGFMISPAGIQPIEVRPYP